MTDVCTSRLAWQQKLRKICAQLTFNHSISRSRERSPSTHPLATVRFRLWDRVLTQNQDLKMAARVTTSIPMSSFPLLSSVQKRPLPSAASRRDLEDTAFLISPSVSWPLLPCDSLKEASHVPAIPPPPRPSPGWVDNLSVLTSCWPGPTPTATRGEHTKSKTRSAGRRSTSRRQRRIKTRPSSAT